MSDFDAPETQTPEPAEPAPRPGLPRPLLTYVLIGINVAVFGVVALFGGGTFDPNVLIRFGAKYDVLIWSGEYWRLITPIFLHAGVIHLVLNSYALYSLGLAVEFLFGRPRYLAIYLISGVMATVASLALSPNLSVGASGAIFGLFGAYMYFAIANRRRIGPGVWSSILPPLLINLGFGLVNPGIDNFAHLGGLLGGLGMAYIVGWRLPPGRGRRVAAVRVVTSVLIVALFLLALAFSLHPPRSKWFYDFDAGNKAVAAGDYASAERFYQSSLAANPENLAGLHNLALVYARTGRTQEAKDTLKKALTINPDYTPAKDLLNELGGP